MAQKTNTAKQNPEDLEQSTASVTSTGIKRYFHHIHLMFPYDITNVSEYNPSLLNTVMSRLVKGSDVVSGVTNKQYFNTISQGGMFITACERRGSNDSFYIHFYLVLINAEPTLSKSVKSGITARFKRMATKGWTAEFESPETPIKDALEVSAEIIGLQIQQLLLDADLECAEVMGKEFTCFCQKVVSDEGTAFGGLVSIVRGMYNQS